MGGFLMPDSYVFGIDGLTNVILLSIIILIENIVKKLSVSDVICLYLQRQHSQNHPKISTLIYHPKTILNIILFYIILFSINVIRVQTSVTYTSWSTYFM